MKEFIDASEHLVCTDPNIWVFDDVLSSEFLGHVDQLFESKELHQSTSTKNGQLRTAKSLRLEGDDGLQELVGAIRKVCHVAEVEPCRGVVISDVVGDTQSPHLDHISLDDLSRRYDNLEFLDLSKQSFSKHDPRKIVPTYSVVVYFNDVGGIRFPNSSMDVDTIPGKRGRVIMFQNYVDDQRPAANPSSNHYGYYFTSNPKRVLTMGILANETPSMSSGLADGTPTPGVLYCPGVLDEPLRHDNPSYWGASEHYDGPSPSYSEPAPPPPPKQDLLVTISVEGKEEFATDVTVTCTRAVSGAELCTFTTSRSDKLNLLRDKIEKSVNPDSDKNVLLCTTGGMLLNKDLDHQSIVELELVQTTVKDIKAMFDKADINKDGFISKDELKEVMKRLASTDGKHPWNFPEAESEDDAKAKVLEAEVPAGGWKKIAPDWDTLTALQQWEKIRSYGETEFDKRVDLLLAQADRNEDGRLNMKEFIDWLYGLKFMGEMNAETLKAAMETHALTEQEAP